MKMLLLHLLYGEEKTTANYWLDVMVIHNYINVNVNYIGSNNNDAEVDSSKYDDDVIK